MFGKRENIVFISPDLRVSNILRENFFHKKSSIYRRFIQFIGDLSPLFFNLSSIFLEMTHVLASSARESHVQFFRWKNQQHSIFRRKIDDFYPFSPFFLEIAFSSAFSSRCRPKTDFSTINRPKKPIFLSMLLAGQIQKPG